VNERDGFAEGRPAERRVVVERPERLDELPARVVRQGRTLGDIDVLAVDVSARRIFAVECKDFQMARMPHEVRTDLEELFISNGNKPCAQERHRRRIEWLKENVDVALASMNVDASQGEWQVEGAFAFSAALISPLLGRAVLPIWTVSELQRAALDRLPPPSALR
jgi:hypothetical protein